MIENGHLSTVTQTTMANAFNATYQQTATICGNPSASPEVLQVNAATYGSVQKLTISPYGEIELQLDAKDGTVLGRARLGVMNASIREAILAYPGSLASRYNDAGTLKEHADWLADLQTATTAALAAIDDLLHPEAVPAG